MKLAFTIAGCLVSLLLFSQKNIQRFASIDALTHAAVRKGNIYLLNSTPPLLVLSPTRNSGTKPPWVKFIQSNLLVKRPTKAVGMHIFI